MADRSWRWFALVALVAVCAGCAQPRHEGADVAEPTARAIRFESNDLRVVVAGVLGVGQERSLVGDPGWLEYVLSIENLSRSELTVDNVKLLTRSGRYLDSASAYPQITTAPDASTVVAGQVARSAAGTAAGQFIPYGGSIVSVIYSAVSASAAEDKADAKRLFMLRRLKGVELAPTGRVNGSAFLPKVDDATALVIRYQIGGKVERFEMALPTSLR